MKALDLLPERVLSKIAVGESCWEWLGWKNDLGYGYIYWEGRDRPAHRIICQIVMGETFGRGIDVDHLCKNPGCVNPSHLEPVTHRTNIRRGRAATKTACKYGHDWTDPANVYIRKNGYRWCAECARQYCKRKRDEKKTART